jgi:hypothetical protein
LPVGLKVSLRAPQALANQIDIRARRADKQRSQLELQLSAHGDVVGWHLVAGKKPNASRKKTLSVPYNFANVDFMEQF